MAEDTRKTLDDIVDLIDAGQLTDADSLCRNALAVKPGDINLLGLMGSIAIARNDPERSIPHFRQVLATDKHNAAAIRGLATALEQTGQEDEADALRDEYMDALPVEHLLAEAEELCRKGDTAEAEKICDAVLRRDPESIGALRVLALAAIENDSFVIAEAFLSRIVRLTPDNADSIIPLARFLGDRGRYEEAIAYLNRATDIDATNPEVNLLLGGMLAIVNRTEESLAAYNKSLEYAPDEPAALIGQAHMLRIAGRQDDALTAYRRCVEVSPGFGVAWWNLASLPRYEASDEDVATMRAELVNGGEPTESSVGLHFALARAYEKRDDFENAWAQYESGNSGKRSLVKYDPVKSELDQSKIRKTYTADVLAGPKGRPSTDVTPVFILGVPRSGSTLVEQVIASHSRVEGAGELPYILTITSGLKSRKSGALHYSELVGELSADELTELGESYLQAAELHRPEGLACFTDKMPANYPHVGFIHQTLPHAKIIDARRDPVATCVANFRQLFAQGKNQSYDLTELGEYYVEYISMMEHWDVVLPGVVLKVQYEEVVADFENQVRRILDHCELPFEDTCLEFHKSVRPVNTASAEQVRQPIYDSAVEFWRNYESHLDELLEVLEPVLST